MEINSEDELAAKIVKEGTVILSCVEEDVLDGVERLTSETYSFNGQLYTVKYTS